jgi:hypothetical protein
MIYNDIEFKNTILRPADALESVLYTVPANKSAKVKLFAYNEGAGANEATVYINSTIILVKDHAAGVAGSLFGTDVELFLAAGDILSVAAETADEVTITANIELFTK